MNWFDEYADKRIIVILYLLFADKNFFDTDIRFKIPNFDVVEEFPKVKYENVIEKSNLVNNKYKHNAALRWTEYENDFDITPIKFKQHDAIFIQNEKLKSQFLISDENIYESYAPNIHNANQYCKKKYVVYLWYFKCELAKFNSNNLMNKMLLWFENTFRFFL